RMRGADTLSDLSAQTFELVADVESTTDMRYFQFQVSLDNQSGTQPLSLTGLNFLFELGPIYDYEYVGECSQVLPPGKWTSLGWLWFLLMGLPILVLQGLRVRLSA
ncbi:MAG TPA: hypothetical protein V6D20_18030, partial [Candidatus Obscuribacterales bacterium]